MIAKSSYNKGGGLDGGTVSLMMDPLWSLSGA